MKQGKLRMGVTLKFKRLEINIFYWYCSCLNFNPAVARPTVKVNQ